MYKSDYKQGKGKKQNPKQVINRKDLVCRTVHKLEEQKEANSAEAKD